MKDNSTSEILKRMGLNSDLNVFDDQIPSELLTREGWLKYLHESPEEKKEREEFLIELKKMSIERGWYKGD